jgi:hypothetical protein
LLLWNPEAVQQFDQAVKESAIPEQQVGKINKEELPGPEYHTNGNPFLCCRRPSVGAHSTTRLSDHLDLTFLAVQQFDQAVKESAIPEQQVGKINKEELPGPEFLTCCSGIADSLTAWSNCCTASGAA